MYVVSKSFVSSQILTITTDLIHRSLCINLKYPKSALESFFTFLKIYCEHDGFHMQVSITNWSYGI